MRIKNEDGVETPVGVVFNPSKFSVSPYLRSSHYHEMSGVPQALPSLQAPTRIKQEPSDDPSPPAVNSQVSIIRVLTFVRLL